MALNPQIAQMLLAMAQRGGGPGAAPPNMHPLYQPQFPKPQVFDLRPQAQQQQPQQRGPIAPNFGAYLQGAGNALLAQSDRGGSFWGNLGRSLPYGQQAIEQRKQEDALNQAIDQSNLPDQFKAALRLLPIAHRGQAYLQAISQPGPEPMSVAEGTDVIDPRTGDLIYTNEPGAEPPNYDAAVSAGLISIGRDPQTTRLPDLTADERRDVLDFAQEYRRSGATQVTVGTEQTQQRGLAETRMEDVQLAVRAGRGAEEARARIDRALNLVETADQGLLAQPTLFLKRLGRSLGMNVEGLTDTEQLKQVIGQELLTAAESLKGALSDNDLKFLRESVAAIGNDAETNRRIFTEMKRAIDRAVAVSRHARKYAREHDDVIGWDYYDERDSLFGELFAADPLGIR